MFFLIFGLKKSRNFNFRPLVIIVFNFICLSVLLETEWEYTNRQQIVIILLIVEITIYNCVYVHCRFFYNAKVSKI